VPPATYLIFLSRDVLTIAGGFTLPPLVSQVIKDSWGLQQKNADKVAQLITPMGMQFICTPLHLLALNMYNQQGVSPGARAAAVWKTCPSSTFIRMFRFLGAYGIGGIGNKSLIAYGREWADNKYCKI